MDSALLIVFIALFIVIPFVKLAMLIGNPQRGAKTINSSKYPPNFSSSLSRKEVLTAVEERLTKIQSLRQQWKTTEKVEKIGRYQAMLTVPFNLAGDNVKISFLLNMLATSREAGGCNVEWNYVLMSPIGENSTQIAVMENEIYKITTLEIRSALFIAQGDAEEAEFLIAKTEPQHTQLPSAREHMKRSVDLGALSPASGPYSPNRAKAPAKIEKAPAQEQAAIPEAPAHESAPILEAPCPALPDIVEAELHSLGKPDSDLGKTPMHVAKSIPGTNLPDLSAEELKNIGDTTAGDPSLMRVPEVQEQMPEVNLQMPEVKSQVPDVDSQMPEVSSQVPNVNSQMPESTMAVSGMDLKLAEIPNPLNFSPPVPTLSTSVYPSKDSKCVKCSQDRDPSFNFCLYCGHSDT